MAEISSVGAGSVNLSGITHIQFKVNKGIESELQMGALGQMKNDMSLRACNVRYL